MLRLALFALLSGLIALPQSGTALAVPCKLSKAGELRVTVDPANRILIDASIKGQPAKLQIDSGAFATIFDATVLSRFGIAKAGEQRDVVGVGGRTNTFHQTIPDLSFGSFVGDNLRWTVSERHFLPDGIYGVLGMDFLGSFDVELDLAHNTINLFKYHECPAEPVYWAPTFSEADLAIRDYALHTTLQLNGLPVEAVIDTGASRTAIMTDFTRRLGLDETSSGMVRAGDVRGIDGRPLPIYTYRFAELHVGDEVIKNPILFVQKQDIRNIDTAPTAAGHIYHDSRPAAILGADFIKTHHIYLAMKDRKMYFTYNGGGIFSPPQDPSAALREQH
ncbi:MAG TPA: retroviral-like aspartic protease family protein [Alphaproteobacteria bacterium]|jgi:predicted aspartyl protease|nr:retroviral-like aspartic protease family protein [Alphaproteobacteria bacterium]